METLRLIVGVVMLSIGILGIVVLGDGISGMMTAESCCFGEDCPSSQLCDAAEPFVESPSSVDVPLIFLGLALVLGSILIHKLVLAN